MTATLVAVPMTEDEVIQGHKVARALALLCALLVSAFAFAADESYYGPRLIEEQIRVPAASGCRQAMTGRVRKRLFAP